MTHVKRYRQVQDLLENKLTTWYRLRSLRESVLYSTGTIFNRAKVVMEPVLMVFQGFLMYKHTGTCFCNKLYHIV